MLILNKYVIINCEINQVYYYNYLVNLPRELPVETEQRNPRKPPGPGGRNRARLVSRRWSHVRFRAHEFSPYMCGHKYRGPMYRHGSVTAVKLSDSLTAGQQLGSLTAAGVKLSRARLTAVQLPICQAVKVLGFFLIAARRCQAAKAP